MSSPRWVRVGLVGVLAGAMLAVPMPLSAATSPSRPAAGDAADGFGVSADRKALASGHATAGGLTVHESRPLTPCGTAWRVIPNTPNGTWNNVIGDMASFSATDVWAVGSAQMSVPPATGDGDMTLAEHWDGSTWAQYVTPNPGANGDDLNAVAGSAGNYVWAVGLKFGSSTPASLVELWNGTYWGEIPPSVGADLGDGLNDVAALTNTDAWAVGFQVVSNGSGGTVQRTLIEHWDGAFWTQATSADTGTGDNQLVAVSAISASDIWAVGFYRATPSSPRSSLVEHWDGTSWTIKTSPNIGSGDTLADVAFDATNSGYAVGYYRGSNGADQPLIVRWNGTTWTDVTGYSVPSVLGEYLTSINEVSATEYWAGGSYINSTTSVKGPWEPYALQGSASGGWTVSTMSAPAGSKQNETFAVAVPASGDVWAGGYTLGSAGIWRTLVENLTGTGAPGITSVTPGDGQVNVQWTAPCPGASPISSYVVTASDGCTVQSSQTVTGSPPATSLAYTGLDNGSPVSFTVKAVNAQGTGPTSAPSATVTPAGAGKPNLISACSTRQYSLPANNGATWTAMDTTNLALSFTPAADSYAVMTGNADLWTPQRGYNQDLGIAVSGGAYPTAPGQPEAWKESGGTVATYSPNAALVQTVIPVSAGVTYSAQLVWKPNHSDPYRIFAGAGPVSGRYSPTRITVQLVAVASNSVVRAVSTLQYGLFNTDGFTWHPMDGHLSVSFSVPSSGYDTVLLAANTDLWTSKAGYNEDFGIAMTGGAYPNNAGQPETWKESGSALAAYSPNAAYVVAGEPVAASTSYTASIVWKANQYDTYTIFAGAGPVAGKYSPTTLVAILVPSAPPGSRIAAGTLQYFQENSDGNTWAQLGDQTLFTTFTPSTGGDFVFVLDADLWTMTDGYNQDAAISISGGAFGAGSEGDGGTLAGWKESGGLAGTFSPNAAALLVPLHLDAGVTYTFTMLWKTNGLSKVYTNIDAGAGPINGHYSPLWLTAVPVT